jgi:hypothetical protein
LQVNIEEKAEAENYDDYEAAEFDEHEYETEEDVEGEEDHKEEQIFAIFFYFKIPLNN